MSTSPAVVNRPVQATFLGPNWFAAVMGSGIVANAALTVAPAWPLMDALAWFAWLVATVALAVLTGVTVHQWVSQPHLARASLADPVLAHFYGAPAMAMMTVGTGAVLLMPHQRIAVVAALALWLLGTTLGVWTTCAIPRRMRGNYAGTAFGGWLMPVVPPMVSAAAGAVLVAHLPGRLQHPMIVICWMLFALALAASARFIVLIVRRVAHRDLGAATTIPTLFIVIGPLGQSATAAHGLAPDAAFTIVYGSIALTLACVWLAVVSRLTLRTARTGLPFAMTWWSFTFPVGTLATGAAGIAEATGWWGFTLTSGAAFTMLVTAWGVVATRTLLGVRSGQLLPRIAVRQLQTA